MQSLPLAPLAQALTSVAVGSVHSITDRILATGQITTADQELLFQASRSTAVLTDTERRKVDQIVQRLKMGLLRMVE